VLNIKRGEGGLSPLGPLFAETLSQKKGEALFKMVHLIFLSFPTLPFPSVSHKRFFGSSDTTEGMNRDKSVLPKRQHDVFAATA
jgi:hypothetical protein